MPPAPPRFSTTTDWLHFALSLAATVRAVMSVPPPGANGTMNVTALAGYVEADCARAPPEMNRQKNRDRPRLFSMARTLSRLHREKALALRLRHQPQELRHRRRLGEMRVEAGGPRPVLVLCEPVAAPRAEESHH